MFELSIVICTHNPRSDYLQRTLDALRAQTLLKEKWELLLIDNASTEPLIGKWDLSWHPYARNVRCDELGLTPARLCGINKSTGNSLVFVDDDNLLAANYLEEALKIGEQNRFLGAFGAGVLKPEFEVAPPKQIIPYLEMLALRSVSSTLWSNNPRDFTCIPWGAGLCATRKTVEQLVQILERLRVNTILDRRGNSLTCGGDDLFSWASSQTGHGFGVFPSLQITHLISAGRLTPPYFLRLVEAHRFSHGVLDYLLTGASPQSQNFVSRLSSLLAAVRKGTFPLLFQRAAAHGQTRAARFIAEQRLEPMPTENTPCPAAMVNK